MKHFKKSLFLLITIILLSEFVHSQDSDCKVNLSDSITTSYIQSSIVGIKTSDINPIELKQSLGVKLDCNFIYNNEINSLARVTSFQYCFKKQNQKIIKLGIINSYKFDSSFYSYIDQIKKGDSLIISDIQAVVSIGGAKIDLYKQNNISINDIRISFNEPVSKNSNEKTFFIQELSKNLTYNNLLEKYSSDVEINHNATILWFISKKNSSKSKMRIQFSSSENLDYDFTFYKNKKGKIFKVFDNLRNKGYTISEWENMIRRKENIN